MNPADIIAALNMQPHPEGGHYVETYRADASAGERADVTAIYFLLLEDKFSLVEDRILVEVSSAGSHSGDTRNDA